MFAEGPLVGTVGKMTGDLAKEGLAFTEALMQENIDALDKGGKKHKKAKVAAEKTLGEIQKIQSEASKPGKIPVEAPASTMQMIEVAPGFAVPAPTYKTSGPTTLYIKGTLKGTGVNGLSLIEGQANGS